MFHQTHHNIVESRKLAVDFLKKNKGLKIMVKDSRQAKFRVISGIMSGIFDGWTYGIDFDVTSPDDFVKVISLSNEAEYFRKIGN